MNTQASTKNEPSTTRSILLVDDDEDDRALISSAIMQASPHNRVNCVAGTEDCLNYLAKSESYSDTGVFPRPVAIITDLRMPTADGFELIQRLRADQRYQDIPVLVFSESKSEEDMDRAYSLGVTQYVVKPGNFRELIQICGELVEHWSRTSLQDAEQAQRAPVDLPRRSSPSRRCH